MKKTITLTIFAFLFAFFSVTVKAANFIVTRADDRSAACVSGVDCSLREAVNAANADAANDTIEFSPNVSVITLGGELVVTNNGSLTLLGHGMDLLRISGNNQTRVFTINAGAVVSMLGLTITEGSGIGANSSGNGGGILILPTANLTLNSVALRNNNVTVIDTPRAPAPDPHLSQGDDSLGTVSGGGGAIFNRGNVVMTESQITGNTTTSIGPQARGSGGGIYNLGTVQLTDSTVDSNQTIVFNEGMGAGGGIYNGFQATLTLLRSTVSNNVGRGNGGGINNNSQATLNVNNSTISYNSALTINGFGGAIINFATINVRNSTIAGNFSQQSGAISSNFSLATFSSGNSIYADNTSPSNSSDFFGNLTSEGYNLIETPFQTVITGNTTGNKLNVDPQLLPLSNFGGLTKTQALRPSSPAIDAGSSFGTTTDQRGKPRPFDNPWIPNSTGGDGSDIGAFERQNGDLPLRAPYDFDGDNKTDIGIFRASDGSWWYSRSSDNAFRVFSFGAGTDVITPGDYTGDGKADLAVFRPADGFWYVQRSEDNSFFSFPFGQAGDVPAPADYDADGKTDAAVFRPSTGTWFILNSGGGGTSIVAFGTAGDKPVPADYDGDGRADIAIFRPSDGSWWYLQSSNVQFRVFRFGLGTDKPVQGDYTGDGRADIAVFRPSTGEWFVQRSEDNSYFSFFWGQAGDVPAPGDFDGDGKFDTAVFRPSTGEWFVQRSSGGTLITTFGASGDRPIPNAYVP